MDTTSGTVMPPAHYGSFEELSSLLKAQNPNWKLVAEFCMGSKLVLIRTEDNRIFRVNHEKLTKLAVGLKEVLKLPDSTNGLLGTELNPIPLLGNPCEVAIFLRWIDHLHWIPLNLDEADLLDLYRFADKWICVSATDWVLQREKNEIGNEPEAMIANAQLYISNQRMSRVVCPPPMANIGFGAEGCPYHGIHHDKSKCA
ncbi:hypothetical protein BDP27DRAFT_1422865 [Rhodocollybia butyracea]|uniref:Uncharacterized protein n=1 Tax=Rhodocollybia butyracea TaxID=206335 RepID=A0A9P5U549_9AGAR|nr:hypothetical protein BDP27DRAFT_1422865 [Rhodocollybia butyracea]